MDAFRETADVIFDLRDVPVTTRQTDRRRGYGAVIVFGACALVLIGLLLAGVSWIADRVDQTETRVRGEQVLAKITWPDRWVAEPVTFDGVGPFGTDPIPNWYQSIITDSTDIAGTGDTVSDVLAAAGWQRTDRCLWLTETPQALCEWRSGDYNLRVSVTIPTKNATATEVTLSLEPVQPANLTTASDSPSA